MKAIGIDIGGTKIAAGLVTDKGQLLDSTVLDIKDIHSPIELMTVLDPVLKRLIEVGGTNISDIAGIGIGSPGPLDVKKGILNNHYTLNQGLYGMNIVDDFQEKYGVPVLLDHDVNTALWAHHCFSDLQGKDSLMLTFGTGIGGAVYKQGSFIRGAGGCAPELGHILINDEDSDCYCGMSGCFEAMASGSALTKEALKHYKKISQFYQAYEDRDPKAVEITKHFVNNIERGLTSLIRSFEPELVILGGGMMEGFYPLFIENLSNDFYKNAFVEGEFEMIHSSFGNHAGLMGAAGLILRGDTNWKG
ncbi:MULTISPECIES: ROK family protein [unclassified Oceanispirochaeta]|uniref:ROK family protein n=1 Tax=unclassified Oceanispirochaeta TaxID=2635722 RepID=UPI000E09D675|nr:MULTISPECIES: ROK family protein [unclassified Oceanispirochaeta]MBF9016528.1 ROK family protein [Oceanispirochaeta sp. M2]NPD72990.1 ROK family protein [Oceanispirochaeta sp. M1]RDG31334.1 ROK family protein [Oceanispirochaeta sp. M1]